MSYDCPDCSIAGLPCNCPASIRPDEPLIDPGPGIRRHASEIRMRILRKMLDNDWWAARVDGAVERATSLGAQQYGNASYFKSDDALDEEGNCELEDWIFYEHIPLERAD